MKYKAFVLLFCLDTIFLLALTDCSSLKIVCLALQRRVSE